MKTVRDVMTSDVIWINPSAPVKSAVVLMGKTGHNIGALPVVGPDERLVGLLNYASVLGVPSDARVHEVMDTQFTTVDPDVSVHDAADLLREAGASHLLVIENDRLIGIVSPTDLITELGKNFDPLTNLPWQDAFRQWAVNALKRGMEISIILFDLDDFGKFNKKYGHVVGDRVLTQVADVLKSGTDSDLDMLCRYAGDEFGIASVRKADDAIALADKLKESISRIDIPEIPEGISGTYGHAGGRRTREREDTHYAATMDDLITRASKNCTASKPKRVEQQPAAAQPEVQAPAATAELSAHHAPIAPPSGAVSRLKIQSISITTTETEATVAVTLARGAYQFARSASGYAVGGKNTLRLVAEAAAGAACKSMVPGHGIVVDEVIAQDTGKEEEVMTVVTTFISPRWSTRSVGSAVVKRGDRYRAVAAALLAAVNRQVESAPQMEFTDEADSGSKPEQTES